MLLTGGHPISDVAVIIPVYNEERFILDVIRSMPDWVRNIVVIDDASADQSVKLIRNCNDPRILLLRHIKNQGVGAAIVTGYRCAIKLGASIAVVMGGDGQMAADDLEALINPILFHNYVYVKGNRFFHTRSLNTMPMIRKIGNLILSYLTRQAIGDPLISDSQCGFTAIRTRFLRKLDLHLLFPGYGFPNDMLFQVNCRNGRVCEVAVQSIYGAENSGIHPLIHPIRILMLILNSYYKKMGNESIWNY